MSNTEFDSFQFKIDDIDYEVEVENKDEPQNIIKYMKEDEESYYKMCSVFLINDSAEVLRKISHGYILDEFVNDENINEKVFQYINAFCIKAKELKTDQIKLKNWINGINESKN